MQGQASDYGASECREAHGLVAQSAGKHTDLSAPSVVAAVVERKEKGATRKKREGCNKFTFTPFAFTCKKNGRVVVTLRASGA